MSFAEGWKKTSESNLNCTFGAIGGGKFRIEKFQIGRFENWVEW